MIICIGYNVMLPHKCVIFFFFLRVCVCVRCIMIKSGYLAYSSRQTQTISLRSEHLILSSGYLENTILTILTLLCT